MKKKIISIVLIAIIIISAVFVFNKGDKPLKKLSATDILSIEITLQPPNTTISLDKEQIKDVVEIFNSIVTYEEDDSYKDYNGQTAIFDITKNDGSKISIMEIAPFVVIDGVGYKVKDESYE